MATHGTVSIPDVIGQITTTWTPKDLVEVNDAIIRIARMDGEFPWHQHAEQDELFICWEGTFRIEFANEEPVHLTQGDCCVVKRGTEHRPVTDGPAIALLVVKPETNHYHGQVQRPV
jgi:mannose-6-phosphate isomerase-like protein (cupin superfamily)